LTTEAHIILEDGTKFKGVSFGGNNTAFGEIVFNTSMTGYQEILTDPSYAGQIVVPTYPMIGNYGISKEANESIKIQVAGLVVRQHCEEPSHADSKMSISDFLHSQDVTGISEIDTRALTRHIRKKGVMMGTIVTNPNIDEATTDLAKITPYGNLDYVQRVTTKDPYQWENPATNKIKILVADFGLKYNILRLLRNRGCAVHVYPSNTSPEDLLDLRPDGILLSPGPGDPQLLNYMVDTTRELLGRVPILGICLGNQVLGMATGAKTYKLKFGHRGGNHPVKDLESGRIHITSQNHGYAIDESTLPSEVSITHVSANDNTVEGIKHRSMPAMGIQYHSESSPGPKDNEYIFDQFISMIKAVK